MVLIWLLDSSFLQFCHYFGVNIKEIRISAVLLLIKKWIIYLLFLSNLLTKSTL